MCSFESLARLNSTKALGKQPTYCSSDLKKGLVQSEPNRQPRVCLRLRLTFWIGKVDRLVRPLSHHDAGPTHVCCGSLSPYGRWQWASCPDRRLCGDLTWSHAPVAVSLSDSVASSAQVCPKMAALRGRARHSVSCPRAHVTVSNAQHCAAPSAPGQAGLWAPHESELPSQLTVIAPIPQPDPALAAAAPHPPHPSHVLHQSVLPGLAHLSER